MFLKELSLLLIAYKTIAEDFCDKLTFHDQSPIALTVQDHSCAYIKLFRLDFPNELTDFKATFHLDRYIFTNFPDNYKLLATDSNKTNFQYTLQTVYVKSPAEHQIIDLNDKIDPSNFYFQSFILLQEEYQIELQFLFQIMGPDLDYNKPQDNYSTAGVSIIFSNRSSVQDKSDYLPDGSSIIEPFFPYRQSAFTDDDNVQYIEANLFQVTKPLVDYYHYWYHYKGRTTIADCKHQTNWYVNGQKFYLPNGLIDRYRKIWATGIAEDSPFYQKTVLEPNNRTIQYNHINQSNYPAVMKICYSGYDETVLRENYALWLWCTVMFWWWVITISTENDTDSCFMPEMNNNKWTKLPFYSLYNVNSDLFFTKLSRYAVWLVQFGWNILILSIQYGQFYRQDRYGVRDAIIIWCAAIAMVTGWPIGYCLGSIMYHSRELVKSNYYWRLEYKKISDKNSNDAVETKKSIDENDERVYTYYFIFYFFAFFIVIAEIIISIWQNIYLSPEEQDYWVASIFVCLFMDYCIFDVIMAVLPFQFTKFRGYFYDFELGQAYKKMEEY